ncbi:MAG: hypothetical protein HZA54_17075 [Planctomycetes bacterium]|nr:hypothetical protein [Planctomycetota bacterium]
MLELSEIRANLLPALARIPRPEGAGAMAPDGTAPPGATEWLLAREFGALWDLSEAVLRLSPDSAPEPPAALARAAVESALDVLLLAHDPTGERARQALAFDRVLVFGAADKLVQFAERVQQPAAERNIRAEAERSAERARERRDELVRHVWGFTRKGEPRYPEHWSGLRTVQRIEALAALAPEAARRIEETYRVGYFETAWLRASTLLADPASAAAAREGTAGIHRGATTELTRLAAEAVWARLGRAAGPGAEGTTTTPPPATAHPDERSA